MMQNNWRRLLFAVVGIFSAMAAGSVTAGGFHTSEIQRLIDRASRDPGFANTPVTVIIEAEAESDIHALITAAGARVRFKADKRHEVTLPGKRLSQLAASLPSGVLMRQSYPYQPLAVINQGVALTGGDDMQALGNNGAGVKIGIIDTGFANYTSAQASGDLPSSLSIVDYTGTGTGGSNHGTNVAEIAYDMAPAAQFYLAKIGTDVQLQQAVTDMIAAGVRVINHSVGWYGAAFYDGTGPICGSVNSAASNNIAWVNAMGNDRFRHYLGMFTDGNNDRQHEFATGQNFNTVTLTAGVRYQFVLNWDAYPATSIDYSLRLFLGNPDSGGTQVAIADTRQASSTPWEHLTYTPSVNGTYYLVVGKRTTNTAHVRLTLFAFGADLGTMTQASSLAQPADCASAIGVAATYPVYDVPEYFSSEGPTTDGRAKPDLAAPDRLQTSLSSSFAGTSASSPLVAGGVAQLRAQNPAMTTDQIRWLLTTTTKDVYTAGFDYRTGNGRMSLDADGDGYNRDTDNCRLVNNPTQADLDGDGIGDACDGDIDGDGLTNAQEAALGTDPRNPDTDGDGLTDGQEVNTYGTNPLLADTDGDGLTDGQEVLTYGTNPKVSNKGDVAPTGTPDGQINVSDLMMLLRFVGQLQIPTARDQILGDMNNDGVLDMRDVLLLRRQLGY